MLSPKSNIILHKSHPKPVLSGQFTVITVGSPGFSASLISTTSSYRTPMAPLFFRSIPFPPPTLFLNSAVNPEMAEERIWPLWTLWLISSLLLVIGYSATRVRRNEKETDKPQNYKSEGFPLVVLSLSSVSLLLRLLLPFYCGWFSNFSLRKNKKDFPISRRTVILSLRAGKIMSLILEHKDAGSAALLLYFLFFSPLLLEGHW